MVIFWLTDDSNHAGTSTTRPRRHVRAVYVPGKVIKSSYSLYSNNLKSHHYLIFLAKEDAQIAKISGGGRRVSQVSQMARNHVEIL